MSTSSQKKPKRGFTLSANQVTIITVIITSILAPVILIFVNRAAQAPPASPTTTLSLASPTATDTPLPPSPTVTATSTATPLPTDTLTPTPTATASPQPGIDLSAGCVYQGNWQAYPAGQKVGVDANGCLQLPSAWGITLSSGSLTLFNPALGEQRGIFGIYTDFPDTGQLKFTITAKSTAGAEFWIGFFDSGSDPLTNGTYFAMTPNGGFRVVSVQDQIENKQTTDNALGTPPQTLTISVDANRLTSIKGQDFTKASVGIFNTIQIPYPHKLFIGYYTYNENFIGLDVTLSNIQIITP